VFQPHESGLIRDDRAGTLAVGLTRGIECARELLEFAGLVVDEFGFGRWRADLEQWRTSCGETLRTYFAREAAAEFYRATAVPNLAPAQWPPALQGNVRATADMIELLVMLRATLQGRGGPSR
jgi:hypothetical protein